MSGFYSQRNAPVPPQLRYDLPHELRRRLWAIIEQHIGRGRDTFLDALAALLQRQYGVLAGPDALGRLVVGAPEDHVVLEHLEFCSDGQALDFFEACYRLNRWCGGQDAVVEVNRAFEQSGIGYRFTDYRGPRLPIGSVQIGRPIPAEQLPQIIRVDHQWTHQEVIVPALQLLANPVFEVANREFLNAEADHRAGRHDDAITKCGSAFESVLKTICTHKGWLFDANRDTCASLVDICQRAGLFPSFYVDLFKRIGTVRNRMGDAHGRGPVPAHDVEAAHAAHMLSMTAAHIVLLVDLGGMA